MDKLLENVHVYSDILRKCSTPEVANWKVEDLQRALSWMNHFVKVHGHIASRQSVVQKFDVQLRKLGTRFGGQELNLEFLKQSCDYLLKALLENPVLPSELREKILNEHASDVLLKHLEDFSSNMLLLSSLTTMHEKLMELQPSLPSVAGQATRSTGTSGLLLVDATCLRDDIAWQLKCSPNQRLNSSVQKRLADITRENGMEVILLVLTRMMEKDEAAQSSELPQQPMQCDPVQRAVLDWLLQEIGPPSSVPSASQQEETMHTIAYDLWSQDPKLLAQVSSKHLDFFKAHIQYLVQQLQKLEMVETFRDDESGNSLPEQEFEMLVSHFQELFAAGDHLKEICVSLIKSRATTPTDKALWSKLHLRLLS